MKNTIGTPYDDVFRTQLIDCSWLIIPVINEVFNENYDESETVILWQNEHFILGDTKRITDSMIQIGKLSKKLYHIECESSPEDGSVIIRVVEYAFNAAIQQSMYENGTLTIRLPLSAVLFLRGRNNESNMMITIQTPAGELSYPVPVIRMGAYELDELFEKKLYFLLPYYLFNYEADFNKINRDDKALFEFKERYAWIRGRLQQLQADGKLDIYTVCLLREMTVKVANGLAANHERIWKGVNETMGGQVLDYEAKRILNKGREEGRVEGRSEGRVQGRELLAEAIHQLRLGMSEDHLLASGYDQETIDLAKTCL